MKVQSRDALQAIVHKAQNGVVKDDTLITKAELAELVQQMRTGELPVWKTPRGTSLDELHALVDDMALLPAEKREVKDAILALRDIGETHATNTKLGAGFRSVWPRLATKVEQAADTTMKVGGAVHQRFAGPPKLTTSEIEVARRATPSAQAALLHRLISPFAPVETRAGERLSQVEDLMRGMGAHDVAALRAAYVEQHGVDPFIHIIGGSLAQPLLTSRVQGSLNLTDLARRFVTSPQRGFENVEGWAVKTYQEIIRAPQSESASSVQALVNAWLAPELMGDATMIATLVDKVSRGEPLSIDERKAYYARLPFIGIRTRSERAHNQPTFEEVALQKVWAELGRTDDLASSMKAVERAFPTLLPTEKAPGQKSVAVVVSSQGAQWQELMGYVMEMQRQGVHVQFFTPEGRPAAFQKDSLSRSNTATLGYGAPENLDAAGPTGMVARELLANAVAASAFRVDDFDQVYIAGGLGLNEDGVRVEAADAKDRSTGMQSGPASVYEAHPDIAAMVNAAALKQIPMLAICHGPSTFIAENVDLDVTGTHMAALGPFEAYVAFTGRTGPAFPHMALVHNDARRAGVNVDPVRDALKPSGVVRDTAKTRDGREVVVVTGPHPASASTLGQAGLELLGIDAPPARYLHRE